jgi:hypothetical protein
MGEGIKIIVEGNGQSLKKYLYMRDFLIDISFFKNIHRHCGG